MHEGLRGFVKSGEEFRLRGMHAALGKRGVVNSPVKVRWKCHKWGNGQYMKEPMVRYGGHWAAYLVQPTRSDPRNGVQTLANE